eukprot:5735819-Pleurochrysis_carterae.AAC.2
MSDTTTSIQGDARMLCSFRSNSCRFPLPASSNREGVQRRGLGQVGGLLKRLSTVVLHACCAGRGTCRDLGPLARWHLGLQIDAVQGVAIRMAVCGRHDQLHFAPSGAVYGIEQLVRRSVRSIILA